MDAYYNLFKRTADGIKPGLEVINEILKELDYPQNKYAIIHVAGTNGKGSVCKMIESILRSSGFKTGLFTSPHLIHFSERYQINGKMISKNKLNRLIISMERMADKICEEKNLRSATFFEISSAIAFQYFADENIDIAIIETGMGGRWDATNVVMPIISVITHIGIDHAEFLGSTLGKIAYEKAGIIKKNRLVVSAPQDKIVKTVLEAEGENVLYSDELVSINEIKKSKKLKITTPSFDLPPINLPLLGKHQHENVSVAISTLNVISNEFNFKPEYKIGLEKVRWPGRFSILSTNPTIIFDVAHNPDAAKVLVNTLNDIYPNTIVGFILGFLEDKDSMGFMNEIKDIAERSWFIDMDMYRGQSALISQKIGDKLLKKSMISTFSDALKNSRLWAINNNAIIVITGSVRLAEKIVDENIDFNIF